MTDREIKNQKRREKYLLNRDKELLACKLYASKNKDRKTQWSREWRRRNRDRNNANQRALRAANPDRHKEYKRKWRERNPGDAQSYYKKNRESVLERTKRYAQRNKARKAEQASNRRAKIKNQTPPDANRDLMLSFYYAAQRITDCTGIPFHVDHHYPIDKGGLHHQCNLRILPSSINCSKGAKLPEEFFQKPLLLAA